MKTITLILGTWNLSPLTFRARSAQTITSVTRWLLVVVGCAVLAMAQPMSAAPEAAPPFPEKPAETSEKSVEKAPADKTAATDKVIYPRNSPERPADLAPASSSSVSSMFTLLAALALAAGGVWVLIQRRQTGALSARGQRKLQIEETRPLGGRQYLIVASYDGKKFLLGVTPGKINLLTPLDSENPVTPQPEVKP